MMMRGSTYVWIAVALGLAALPVCGRASVHGPCSDCHTMHNSQDNLPMTYNGSITPNNILLRRTCIACHTGTNTGATDVSPYNPPYVDDVNSVPIYSPDGSGGNTLAGGNFYWVQNGADRDGHNVNGIAAVDATLGNTPPGYGTVNPMTAQLECAGVNGCHGDRTVSPPIMAMHGSHHNDDPGSWKDGTTLAKSYRFLNGIQGFGDPKYEYQPTVSRHNKYFGVDRTAETDAADTQPLGGTISSLCAKCHQDFHDGPNPTLLPSGSANFASGGVWIRHPTDYDMSNATSSTEYTFYNGGTGSGNPYSLVAPLATSQNTTAVQTTVYSVSDDAIVMCLSCHRAHGSPYASMLRWNYRAWPGKDSLGNVVYNGCVVCHTTKD